VILDYVSKAKLCHDVSEEHRHVLLMLQSPGVVSMYSLELDSNHTICLPTLNNEPDGDRRAIQQQTDPNYIAIVRRYG
jgi:hypothetical protein